MNRSLANVLFSGFGSPKAAKAVEGEVKPISVEDAYYILEAASNVCFVPGYGMAVAQAQHVVKELGEILERNGCEVSYAIHPVAGRMPGHMNVLLAEADVPYEQLVEMDDINPRIENVDVAIVIGANDVVNPSAREDSDSPIYGMPIINVDRARLVFQTSAHGFGLFGCRQSTVLWRKHSDAVPEMQREYLWGGERVRQLGQSAQTRSAINSVPMALRQTIASPSFHTTDDMNQRRLWFDIRFNTTKPVKN